MCLCDYVKKETLFIFIFLFYVILIEVSSERIYFPDEINNYKRDSSKQFQDKSAKLSDKEDGEIPIDLIQKLNSIQNASELFEEFLIKDTGKHSKGGFFSMASRLRTSPYVSDRSGDVEEEIKATELSFLAASNTDGVSRNANIKMAPPAICKPELHTIPLYTPEDRRIFAFPSCTRVERCGGCCQHELLSCQPIKTETLNYQVILMQYVGNNKFNNIGKEIIPVEKHTACKCICITKKEDCTPLQEYKESDCKCVCTNKDEEKKCSADADNKLWDPHTCTCKCRDIAECGSGQFFSDATCGCEAIRASSGSSKEDRINYNVYNVFTPYNLRNERRQT